MRPYNFSAGPAALPESVLTQAAAEMLDWHGTGMSVMEMSHRGAAFTGIAQQAEQLLRELLAVPSHFHILFMQGGGLAENAIVPMNLCGGTPTPKVDVAVTGGWSEKSAKEARKYADVHIAFHNQANGLHNHTTLARPEQWQLRPDANYIHICSNETIHGVEFHDLPDLQGLGLSAPLVVDASSQILSRPVEWSKIGVLFAGAQKNIGPAGLTIVIVRDDLLHQAMPICPSAFQYRLVADNHSMYNTPPTYGIYMAKLVFEWIQAQGGVNAMEQCAIQKSQALYTTIDTSEGFYTNHVETHCRSRMNIPFFLRDDALYESFLKQAQSHGLVQLKGHKSVGGLRASIYNAMPLAGVQALAQFMRDFAQRNG
jgi:phosphoserine aminotransferase